MLHPDHFSDVSRETLEDFRQLLLKWNKKINLISKAATDDFWSRHVLNSAALQDHMKPNESIVDLGSGGGFPGLVLSILDPERTVHLVEADKRKASFLREAARRYELNALVHNIRVEQLAPLDTRTITSRGFASVLRTFELTTRLHGSDLRFLLLKGRTVDDEIKEAQMDWVFTAQRYPMPDHSDGCILEVCDLRRR